MKTILIAIPTAKNIEPSTFKSIYDLEVPEGYVTDFQYFYGYNIDQVRNLIAHWAEKYDYLFSVDSDISFPRDTLKKLLARNVDIVSGLYIQRKPGEHILEVYMPNDKGGCQPIPYSMIRNIPFVEVVGCGFGCVLVKSEVFRSVGYPYFKYHSAIKHEDTISEDVDFCRKARAKGFRIFADTSILCDHTGSSVFKVADTPPTYTVEDRLHDIASQPWLPKAHSDYLAHIKTEGVEPKVIYDLGACVLHWTTAAKRVWPNAEYFAFEAMDKSEYIFKEKGVPYHIAVLSDVDGKDIEFYQNDYNPAGNSYYKENKQYNPAADDYFNDGNKRLLKARTLDSVVAERGFPAPDMIKMDVQGAEMDVLRGATETLKSCKNLILELQKVEYNKGAPLREQVIPFVESLGFKLKTGPFCDNGPDGDYHFVRD